MGHAELHYVKDTSIWILAKPTIWASATLLEWSTSSKFSYRRRRLCRRSPERLWWAEAIWNKRIWLNPGNKSSGSGTWPKSSRQPSPRCSGRPCTTWDTAGRITASKLCHTRRLRFNITQILRHRQYPHWVAGALQEHDGLYCEGRCDWSHWCMKSETSMIKCIICLGIFRLALHRPLCHIFFCWTVVPVRTKRLLPEGKGGHG